MMNMYMNWSIIAFDTFIGALVLGTISTLGQYYMYQAQYYKILAFVWSVPLTFFFFINMASRAGIIHVINFSRHAIIGTTLTGLLAIMTILLQHLPMQYLVYLNLLLAVSFVALYFGLQIYEII